MFWRKHRPYAHFLHIGKTGGTAVSWAIKRGKPKSYRVVLHPHRVRLCDIPEGEAVFFFLRDPTSRFVSGFYSRMRQGRPRYFSAWSPDEAEAFARFKTPNALAMALPSEPAQKAMRSIGHVRSSYWEWFESEQYFLSRRTDILFVGFQERLDRDFERLKHTLGIAPHVSLPASDRDAHRSPSDVDRHMSDQAIRALREWYSRDYQLIEICTRLASLHCPTSRPPPIVSQRSVVE